MQYFTDMQCGCLYMGYKLKEEGKGNQQCIFYKYTLEKVVNLAYVQYHLKNKGGENEKMF